MHRDNETWKERAFSAFDIALIVVTILALISHVFLPDPRASDITLAFISFLGLLPVIWSAYLALREKRLSVDLLASIALIFSLLAQEWFSAAFITLMLAFARLFDRITEARAKKVIQSLMKYHVESVRLRVGETIKEVHIREVKKGDLVIVESGERMPVDGVVVNGTADINESSLTGESELVPKKPGDLVHTATVNESGSLVIRAEKVGADTTLSRIINLIDEASRKKNKAEQTADRFTQWYITLTLIASIAMYVLGLNPREILAVLLVVCADDIAVAVPLAFTAAISQAARRGVLVKGSTVFEQLSRLKYVLTDKTGTLTRGKPRVVKVRAYGTHTEEYILERFGMGASESRHMVSAAVREYIDEKQMRIHAPTESQEIPGQGIVFRHEREHMLLGRLSFMEHQKVHIHDDVRRDVMAEKDAGHGIALLAIDGAIAGLVAYSDELRPHVRDIIAETKMLGVREWHMLTGDNERAAKVVATELGLRHYHANMTPESKLEFVQHFERERRHGDVVGYIGDGVNDAASLALVDVSVAMGGIGADAAIEAADITIMKDRLDRLPETMRMSRKVMNVMWWNFAIWAITNTVGLSLVVFGVIGPAGAATYNFLTDFIPIANALRAGRRVKNAR